MNIDEKIKQELESEAEELDQVLASDSGLFERVGLLFKGSMRRWIIVANIVIMLLTAIFLWAAYQFFITDDVKDLVFWGVIFIVGITMQIAMKQWLFMEMNRNAFIREIKKLELILAKLENKITKHDS